MVAKLSIGFHQSKSMQEPDPQERGTINTPNDRRIDTSWIQLWQWPQKKSHNYERDQSLDIMMHITAKLNAENEEGINCLKKISRSVATLISWVWCFGSHDMKHQRIGSKWVEDSTSIIHARGRADRANLGDWRRWGNLNPEILNFPNSRVNTGTPFGTFPPFVNHCPE
jgi:hypothetical protein